MNQPTKAAGPKGQLASKAVAVTFVTLALICSGPAVAGDPCKTVICMYGKFTGNSGGGECSSAERDYFNILVKKKGKIKWDSTASMRGEFLNSCSSADRGFTKQINNKFGKVAG